jgi:hypothetical protein
MNTEINLVSIRYKVFVDQLNKYKKDGGPRSKLPCFLKMVVGVSFYLCVFPS